MSAERTLLLVDDEANILKSLTRTLRRDGYNILTASGGEEGLDVLSKHEVGVVVSDQRMPGMQGSEFLRHVHERCPDTVRIMLSGYTELTSVTDAINQGAIYKFLTKPWEDTLLRENILEAFDHYDLRHENKRLASEISELNTSLEERVKQRTHDLTLSMRCLEMERNMLESLPCAVIAVDSEGVIVNANNDANNMFDKYKAGLIGKEANQELPEVLRTVLSGENAGSGSAIMLPYDEKMMTVNIRSLGDGVEFRGFVLVCMLIERNKCIQE